MWIQTCWLGLLIFFEYQNIASAVEEEDFSFTEHITTGTGADEWYMIGHNVYGRTHPVCNNSITTAVIRYATSLRINFQPKNQFGILGISLCRDKTLENCLVIEIFGLVSGRMGYFWRKQSRSESGEELWVPGKKTKLPSTLIKSDVAARKGTWDQEGTTLYQFFIVTAVYDNKVRILYNGGTAKQQKEMTFEVPDFAYPVLTVESFYNDSKVDIEGAIGCTVFKRVQFQPGQDLYISWGDPLGALGISFCTDSGQYECYVLELVGASKGRILNYFWRKHSLFEEGGKEGWVPGLETKLAGMVLAQGENEFKYMDSSAWTVAERGCTLFIERTIDNKLVVHFSEIMRDSYAAAYFIQFTLDVPSNFQFTTVGDRVIVDGIERHRNKIVTYGPCFNGRNLDFVTPTCNQRIPSEDPTWPEDKYFYRFSPKPALAMATLTSNVLDPKPTRKTLCLSVLGIASEKGGSVTLTAMDASGSSNETVHVGELAYNKIFPLEWQRVRMSVDLPPSLLNVPLVVKMTSKRPTADSFVLVSEAILCSTGGCGLATAEGKPFIAHGEKSFPAKYPWHVAIFKKINETYFNYICGGTLIRSDAVLSAAHCFTDDQGKKLNNDKFKLAVGKVYNSLYIYEPNQQLSDALDIYIPTRYNGQLTSFIHDIALVRINFTTSPLILPACLDWFGNNASGVQPGDVGQVAGWGLHENNLQSSELYFAYLPFISYDQCTKAVPKTFLVYVTPDKFCAGNINGSTVRKGDSGGGLVFEKGGLLYLRGVVSLGVPDRLTYTTFTEVSHFMPWIRRSLNVTS